MHAGASSDGQPAARATVLVRPIASPLPVTLLALAVASLVVSGQELGWYSPLDKPLVGWILIGFPAPLQLISMAWAFVTRSAPATAAAAVLSATWLATGLVDLHSGPAIPTPVPLGVMMLAAGGCLALVAVLQGASSAIAPAVVFAAAALRFVLSGVSGVSSVESWQDAAGVLGLVISALAAYVALAAMLEESLGREVLPVGRRAAGAVGQEAPLDAQLDGVAHEPGVRRVL
jgi:succinate-acetate transporter protein